jgi:hypothetical protein
MKTELNMWPTCASFLLSYTGTNHISTPSHYADRTPEQQPFSWKDRPSGRITCTPACGAAETRLRQKNTALLSTLSFEHQTAVHAVGSSRGQGTVRNITVVKNKSQVLVLTEEFAVDLGNAFVWVKEPTLRTALLWVTAQLVVVIPCRRFGTTYRSHLQGKASLRKNPKRVYLSSTSRWQLGNHQQPIYSV